MCSTNNIILKKNRVPAHVVCLHVVYCREAGDREGDELRNTGHRVPRQLVIIQFYTIHVIG